MPEESDNQVLAFYRAPDVAISLPIENPSASCSMASTIPKPAQQGPDYPYNPSSLPHLQPREVDNRQQFWPAQQPEKMAMEEFHSGSYTREKHTDSERTFPAARKNTPIPVGECPSTATSPFPPLPGQKTAASPPPAVISTSPSSADRTVNTALRTVMFKCPYGGCDFHSIYKWALQDHVKHGVCTNYDEDDLICDLVQRRPRNVTKFRIVDRQDFKTRSRGQLKSVEEYIKLLWRSNQTYQYVMIGVFPLSLLIFTI